jgi:hypothetical protein
LTFSSARFDNVCAPSVHFSIEARNNFAHFALEIGAFGVMSRHFDCFLPKGVGDSALVSARFSQDHRYGMPEAIEREANADLLSRAPI